MSQRKIVDIVDNNVKVSLLYEKYKNLMYRIAFKILKNGYDSEDAVQQSFVSVIENINKVDDVESPRTKALLAVIVEHKALDILRKEKNTIDIDDVEMGIEIPLPGDNGLADAMASLLPRYRQMLLLHYDAGYSTKEIGEFLHMPIGTVQKNMWRAKQKLKEKLCIQEAFAR